MLPLDQGRFVTYVIPDGVCETACLTWVETGHPRLFLDCLKELMLVDFAVQLPKDVLALVVSKPLRTIANNFSEVLVLVWRTRQVRVLEVDGLFHKDPWARGLKIGTSLWIVGQFREVDL